MKSLAQESKLHPELKLEQVFPLAKTNYDYNFVALPTVLSPAAPSAATAYLDYINPDEVGHIGSNVFGALYSGKPGAYLIAVLNLSPGTYLLDFSVDALVASDPMKVSIHLFQNTLVTMETDITQGHLLVPILISKTGLYNIQVSRPSGWVFYSVEVNKA
jgi:hypothetical protein